MQSVYGMKSWERCSGATLSISKWEYCLVMTSAGGREESSAPRHAPDADKVTASIYGGTMAQMVRRDYRSIGEALVTLGMEGWDLIACQVLHVHTIAFFFLTRPAENV